MGGGQPVNAGPRTRKARMKGLYDTDINTQIKKSNENPMILSLYDTLLKGKEHELLHRNFSGKEEHVSVDTQSPEVFSGLCFCLYGGMVWCIL